MQASDNLSLEVPEEAIFALLGPERCRQDDAAQNPSEHLAPDSGSATVMGIDTRRLGPTELAQIGYLSENQRLPEWMRVGEFLQYCCRFYSQWDHALAITGDHVAPPPRPQACRLVTGKSPEGSAGFGAGIPTQVLILDEPFSGLDVLVRDEISETILGEASGLTVLLASHDLADLESFASHVAYLHEGRLLFSEEMPSLAARYREVEVTLGVAWLRFTEGLACRVAESRADTARRPFHRFAIRSGTGPSVLSRRSFHQHRAACPCGESSSRWRGQGENSMIWLILKKDLRRGLSCPPYLRR